MGPGYGHSSLESLKDQDKVQKREKQAAKKHADALLQNRHWTDKKVDEMEERYALEDLSLCFVQRFIVVLFACSDWRIFKEDFSIQTRGPRVPHPLRYWDEAKLPVGIKRAIDLAGYKAPTPIQRAAIPVGLRNMDVVGIAETGSGKTCAFLIPMLVYISTLPPLEGKLTLEVLCFCCSTLLSMFLIRVGAQGPYAIALAPTRELAQQISDEATKLGAEMGIRNVAIVGGQSIEEQGLFSHFLFYFFQFNSVYHFDLLTGFSMRDGSEIVIATPGRLYDCIERRYLVCSPALVFNLYTRNSLVPNLLCRC